MEIVGRIKSPIARTPKNQCVSQPVWAGDALCKSSLCTGFWLKVAFSNFYAYYNKLSQQIGWETLEASLEVQNICDDVKNGWDQDPIHISTLYNHVGAGMTSHRTVWPRLRSKQTTGMGIAGSVLSNVPGVGPLLGIGSSVMGAYFSVSYYKTLIIQPKIR